MRHFRVSPTDSQAGYTDQILLRLIHELHNNFDGLIYQKHYGIELINSVETYTIQLKSLSPKSVRAIMRQKDTVNVIVQASTNRPAIMSHVANDLNITVPKPDVFRSPLTMADLFNQGLVPSRGPLSLMGVDINNQPVTKNLAIWEEAHSSYIGASRSGKSNMQQLDIFNLVKNLNPNQIRIFPIEIQKGFGDWFRGFKHLPHLACKPIGLNNWTGALSLIAWLKNEIAKRSEILEEYGQDGIDQLPRYLLLIDELKTLIEALKANKKLDEYKQLVGPILRSGLAVRIHVSIATHDATDDGLGSKDLLNNIGARFCVKVGNKSEARRALGGGSETTIPILPSHVGQSISHIDGTMKFLNSPKLDQQYVDKLPLSGPLPYLVKPDEIETEELSKVIDSDCPIHDDWQGLADKPAKNVFTGLLLNGAKGRPTTDTIKAAGLTTNTTEASQLREKVIGLRDSFESALESVENDENSKDGFYNPFPCPAIE